MKAVEHTVNFAVIMVFCACLSVFSQGKVVQERVTIKSIIGKAEVRSPKTGKWRPARVGMTVKMKWDIRTYVESTLEIAFASGTVIKLGENSVVNLSTLLQDRSDAATKSNVKVSSGQVWANVKKLVNKKSKFSFETPTAVAAIRGTRLGVSVDKSRTVIDVYEGKVSVRNKGSKKEVIITTRNRAIVTSGEADVKTYTFDEVKSESDTTSGMPVVDDVYATDTTVADTTAPVDTTSEVDTAQEVYLTIESPDNNSVVDEPKVVVKGTATPGAKIIVGTKQATVSSDGSFSVTVNVIPGVNTIVVTAQLGTSSKQEEVSIQFIPQKSLFLSVTKPTDGMKIAKPIIPVQGVTLPGAEVIVNDNEVSVGADGSFIFQAHIPDEPDEYTVRIVCRYKGQEKEITIAVVYEPEYEDLELTIASPQERQVITTNSIRVIGKAVYKAKIEVAGGDGTFTRAFTVSNTDGSFSCDIPLTERDIGEYTLEISASTDAAGGEDIEKTVIVEVDIKSASINISVPEIIILGQLTGGTRNGYITAQVIDRTPEDQITLTADINGSKDQYILEPSEHEKVDLEEGKNKYILIAEDLAGNKSPAANGDIYYLPGPLTIDIVEPDESQYVIDDLPPMPNNTGALSMDIEVEIEDGIGDVSETIMYCRVNGANLKETRNYIYEGKLPLVRGANNFLIEVEDMAGNREKKIFTITINE